MREQIRPIKDIKKDAMSRAPEGKNGHVCDPRVNIPGSKKQRNQSEREKRPFYLKTRPVESGGRNAPKCARIDEPGSEPHKKAGFKNMAPKRALSVISDNESRAEKRREQKSC